MAQPQRVEHPSNPWIVTLVVAGIAGLVLAGVLGLVALSARDDYPVDLELIAGLGAWSDFLLVAGVVSLVGAFVVAGVEWTLNHPRQRA